jgi:ribosomal protein L33
VAKDGPRIKILLRSSEGTGTRDDQEPADDDAKLELRKYDRVVRRHVVFRETKA